MTHEVWIFRRPSQEAIHVFECNVLYHSCFDLGFKGPQNCTDYSPNAQQRSAETVIQFAGATVWVDAIRSSLHLLLLSASPHDRNGC